MTLPWDLIARYAGQTARELEDAARGFIRGAVRDGVAEAAKQYPLAGPGAPRVAGGDRSAATPPGVFKFDQRVTIFSFYPISLGTPQIDSVVLLQVPPHRTARLTHFALGSPDPLAQWLVSYSLRINGQPLPDYNRIVDMVNFGIFDLTEVNIEVQPNSRVEIQSVAENLEGRRSAGNSFQSTARLKGYFY